MEVQLNRPLLSDARRHPKNSTRSVRWVKEWVPQDLASAGGKCFMLKWVREDMLKVLKERCKESVSEEAEPDPTSEVLFLCSFEGCGKTFIDAGAIRKHSHVHGDRQHVCQYEGCGKKFLDGSKLKRHHFSHTGQRDYICPHDGCGKAFSLDFNLKAHMRTHTQENYRVCPYQDCGKRYAHDYKLQAHIRFYHEKNLVMNALKHTPPAEKQHSLLKTATAMHRLSSSDRPYACPYYGCGKAYIHGYKLNLHLKREHPGHSADGKGNHSSTLVVDCDVNEVESRSGNWRGSGHKILKRKERADMIREPSKVSPTVSFSPCNEATLEPQWHTRRAYEEDSEETHEDHRDMEEHSQVSNNSEEETDGEED